MVVFLRMVTEPRNTNITSSKAKQKWSARCSKCMHRRHKMDFEPASHHAPSREMKKARIPPSLSASLGH